MFEQLVLMELAGCQIQSLWQPWALRQRNLWLCTASDSPPGVPSCQLRSSRNKKLKLQLDRNLYPIKYRKIVVKILWHCNLKISIDLNFQHVSVTILFKFIYLLYAWMYVLSTWCLCTIWVQCKRRPAGGGGVPGGRVAKAVNHLPECSESSL